MCARFLIFLVSASSRKLEIRHNLHSQRKHEGGIHPRSLDLKHMQNNQTRGRELQHFIKTLKTRWHNINTSQVFHFNIINVLRTQITLTRYYSWTSSFWKILTQHVGTLWLLKLPFAVQHLVTSWNVNSEWLFSPLLEKSTGNASRVFLIWVQYAKALSPINLMCFASSSPFP